MAEISQGLVFKLPSSCFNSMYSKPFAQRCTISIPDYRQAYDWLKRPTQHTLKYNDEYKLLVMKHKLLVKNK